ncbi:NAD-dependent epimerase/dehydratase family protein [Ferruginibacter sp.]|uniref:NAD-dependent epimerase/dehydratase family protein n=1 Tax=Ferruginibacter sp. TaxID=1940288 RepID=UPI00198361C9|nr:NAD-dependent epimerase/dehydratase family protein [Ferruginibacter sp.]MBC7628957.1 NAD-dependent epimerase/dehydratase family protein [Ferruginibacter sp.]
MKVLVTGGTGFIGSFVVEALLQDGHEVLVIANGRQLPAYLEMLTNQITYYQGDFGETDILEKALPGCDAVIHLAWSTVPKQTKGATAFEFSSNIPGNINLIEKCIDFKVDKFIFISSGGTVYGIPDQIPLTELHGLNPISNYGLGKLTMEKLLHLYNYTHNIKYTILRVSNAYGERQNLYKNQGVIGVWLKNIVQKKKIEIWGDGSVVRDYVYVKDVAAAVLNALAQIKNTSIYNIGGGKGYSLNDIVAAINTGLNIGVEVEYKPSRNFDVPVNILDISKAQKEIGFKPTIGLAEGIIRTWKWIQKEVVY